MFARKQGKKRTSQLYNVEDIYVLKTYIISDTYDGKGPRSVVNFFLARKENEKYYEIFSNVEFDPNAKRLNIPIIDEIKPLREYTGDKFKQKMSNELLFYFILGLNTENSMQNEV